MDPHAPTISIAMATYNGAAFLEAQLLSILHQTLLPLELVISDDGSTDGTALIAKRFADEAPFEVRVLANATRLGFANNFMRAAELCRGELIAWSDQDDVWMPQKLARCAAEFQADPEVALVIHSRRIGDWRRRGRAMIRGGPTGSASTAGRRRRVFGPESLPLYFSPPGYASLVRRRVVDASRRYWSHATSIGNQGHDTWTAFVASASGKVVFIPDALVYYRQHQTNTIGAPPPESTRRRLRASARRTRAQTVNELERQKRQAAAYVCALAALGEELPKPGVEARLVKWRRRCHALKRRLDYYRQFPNQTLWSLLHNAARGDYARRSAGGLGISSAIRDAWHCLNRSSRATVSSAESP